MKGIAMSGLGSNRFCMLGSQSQWIYGLWAWSSLSQYCRKIQKESQLQILTKASYLDVPNDGIYKQSWERIQSTSAVELSIQRSTSGITGWNRSGLSFN